MVGESRDLSRVTPPAWSPCPCWHLAHQTAMLQNHQQMGFSAPDRTLKVGIRGAEMDAPRNVMETLPSDQGTHKRDMVSPVSTGLPSLFTVSPMFGSRPRCKQQHSWIWFHSFSQSKQTQTALPAVSAWGAPGQASSSHGCCTQPAAGWVGCSRLHPPCPPPSAQAPTPPCTLLVGEGSPFLHTAEGLRAAMPLAQG